MKDYSGSIDVGGKDPHFFQIYDGRSSFSMGFNANDGAGNGGLIGVAGDQFNCGTGYYGYWTYKRVYGSNEEVGKWHHYVFEWNKNGLPCFTKRIRKEAVFIDGVLNSHRWSAAEASPKEFYPLTAGVFNIITTGNPPFNFNIMDELKIYDGHNTLVLWNSLGSIKEVTHSIVGPNGSYNGGGNPQFVKGIKGNAIKATPVSGVGSL